MDDHQISYEDLIAYAADTLDAEQYARVAGHLSVCDECAKTVASINTMRNLLRGDDSEAPAPRAEARAKTIFTQYRPEHHPQWYRFSIFSRAMPFAAGFAMALVLLVGLGSIVANLDIPTDNALYPVKVAVQGFQVTVSNVGRYIGAKAYPTAIPTSAGSGYTLRQAPRSDIVISQVYGGGGNAGATFTHDFIELFNRGDTTISLAGWSLQYTSATGTNNFGAGATYLTELPNVSLAPGQYLLIQEARGNRGTVPLPTPDVIDPTPISLSAAEGKIALVRTTTPLGCNGGTNSCIPSVLENIVDLVGYGKADFFEGIGPAPAAGDTMAVLRANNGCTETNCNMDDFASGAPNPRNSTFPRVSCPSAVPKR
jgi:hypothetical protein